MESRRDVQTFKMTDHLHVFNRVVGSSAAQKLVRAQALEWSSRVMGSVCLVGLMSLVIYRVVLKPMIKPRHIRR